MVYIDKIVYTKGGDNLKQYTIYMHISPNNKRYIGITSREAKKRWNNGNGYRNNIHFWNAINKYGWDNFQHIIIAKGLNKETAQWLEIELIREWDSTNPNKGYNVTLGGEGGNGRIWSDKERERMSKRMTGEGNPMYGKYGELNPLYGRTWWDENTPQEKIDEWRENHRKGHESFKGEGNPFYGKKHSEETKRIIGEKSKGRISVNRKQVILLNTLEIFESIEKASELTGINRNAIRNCCNNKRKNTKDKSNNCLIWMFYKDYIEGTDYQIKMKIIKGKNDIREKDSPVVCLTTKVFFTSISKAQKHYSLGEGSSIGKCCSGIGYKSAGKLKDGTPLVWRYLIVNHNKKYRIKSSK